MDKFIEIIELATRAPSGHNTQPWKFSINNEAIRIYPDKSRSLPIVDFDNHELYISIGCALENLLIAAQQYGFKTDVKYFLDIEKEYIEVGLTKSDDLSREQALFDAILKRQSNRAFYNRAPIPKEHLEQLQAAAEQEGIRFEIFSDAEEIPPFISWVERSTLLQYSDPGFLKELVQWMRFTSAETEQFKDGLSVKLLGIPYLPRWLGKIMVRYFFPPKEIANKFLRAVRSSSALLLFSVKETNKMNWINAGRSFERVFLTATNLGIDLCLINMPCEVPSINEEMQAELLLGNTKPVLLARIGYAQKTMDYSMRRPIEDVIITE